MGAAARDPRCRSLHVVRGLPQAPPPGHEVAERFALGSRHDPDQEHQRQHVPDERQSGVLDESWVYVELPSNRYDGGQQEQPGHTSGKRTPEVSGQRAGTTPVTAWSKDLIAEVLPMAPPHGTETRR